DRHAQALARLELRERGEIDLDSGAEGARGDGARARALQRLGRSDELQHDLATLEARAAHRGRSKLERLRARDRLHPPGRDVVAAAVASDLLSGDVAGRGQLRGRVGLPGGYGQRAQRSRCEGGAPLEAGRLVDRLVVVALVVDLQDPLLVVVEDL